MHMLHKRQSGFTIVELAVVIAVIGVLVSLSVFSYGNWRQRTAQNEVKSDLNGVMSAMENARNFSNGYPSAIPASFDESANVNLTYVGGTLASYCMNGVSSVDATVKFYIKPPSVVTPTTGSCTFP